MILESFLLFISSVSELRLEEVKKFPPPSHSSQGATTQRQNYPLFLKALDAVFFIYVCQKLFFLWEKVLILKSQVLKSTRKHRNNIQWNSSKQQGLTWFITIRLHKHWVILEILGKCCYTIIKENLLPVPWDTTKNGDTYRCPLAGDFSSGWSLRSAGSRERILSGEEWYKTEYE